MSRSSILGHCVPGIHSFYDGDDYVVDDDGDDGGDVDDGVDDGDDDYVDDGDEWMMCQG